ncbi:MAG: sodium-dependent bicarbonate transport family permease, partial [Pseudomonadota bacterium]
MEATLNLAISNLTSPMILFFALGLLAALARSDLVVPEAIAKGLSLYLMMAIGFKGGASVAQHGVDATLLLSLLVGILLSALIPVLAFNALRFTTGLSTVDAAAIAAHYGSISIVTFLAMTQAIEGLGIDYEGYMVAVAA